MTARNARRVSGPGNGRRLAPLATGALLAAATLAVYWPVTGYGFILLDDPDYVANNTRVQEGLTADGIAWAFTTSHAANWHPVTWISHMLDVELLGASPSGHHTVNLLLHALNAVLLLAFLYRSTERLWPSAFVAAAFALHPVNVETVAWIAERKNVLATSLWLITMLLYRSWTRRGGAGRYLAVLGSLLLGLLAKPTVVALPFALILVDFWPLRRVGAGGVTFRRACIEKVPLIVPAVAASMATIWAQGAGDTIRDVVELPMGYRLANALVCYVRYLGNLVWPSDLVLVYPHPAIGADGSPWPWWLPAGCAIVLATVTAAVVLQARRVRAEGAGPFLAVGWTWYLLTLFPMIGILQVGPQAMADRYVYVAFIGPLVMIAWGTAESCARWRVPRPATAVAALVVLAALSSVTVHQLRFWKDSETLFSRSLARTENNWLIHSLMGVQRVTDGQIDRGIVHLRESLRIHPDQPKTLHNLANALQVRGEHEEAVDHLLEAIRLSPGYARAHYRLGISYIALGRYDEAREHLLEAVRLVPEFAEAHYRLALAAGPVGRPAEAIDAARRALELRPDWQRPASFLERVFETAPQARELDTVPPEAVPVILRAVGAGYVAVGETESFLATAELARGLAISMNQISLAARIDGEIARVEAGMQPDRPDGAP